MVAKDSTEASFSTLSRRTFMMRAAVVGAFSGTFATLLAACGGSSTATQAVGASTSAAAPTTGTSSGGAGTTPPAAAGGTTPAAGAASPVPAGAVPTAAANIKRGGTLTWAFTTNPLKLDPVWTQARTDGIVLANMIEPMVRANEKADLVPALASKWDISTDGLIYTFNLAQGVKFHNGKTLVADDVLASLERSRTMGTYKWTQDNVTSVAKVDDNTVKITLSGKVASFIARMAVLSNAIFPAEEIAQIGQQEFQKPIGTGPFMFKERVINDHLTLDKNPNYRVMAPDGKPFPYLDQILIKQVPEDTTKVLQIQGGQLSGAESIPYSQIAALQKDARGQVVTFPQQQIQFFEFEIEKPPFDDPKVRQALSFALDRKVFVDRATAGVGEAGISFFPKSGLYWNGDLKIPYDVEQAKKLVAESKYPQGRSGNKIQVPSGNQLGRDNAVLAQDMWGKIGFNMTIEEIDGSTLSANRLKGDYEVISGYQWTNGMADPDQQVQFYIVDPRFNSGYQPSQQMLDLVKQASAELDTTQRGKLYAQIQDIYNQDLGGTITLYYTPSVQYLSPDVKGFFRSPLGVPFWWQTWLSK